MGGEDGGGVWAVRVKKSERIVSLPFIVVFGDDCPRGLPGIEHVMGTPTGASRRVKRTCTISVVESTRHEIFGKTPEKNEKPDSRGVCSFDMEWEAPVQTRGTPYGRIPSCHPECGRAL